jgi:hypothetical protein
MACPLEKADRHTKGAIMIGFATQKQVVGRGVPTFTARGPAAARRTPLAASIAASALALLAAGPSYSQNAPPAPVAGSRGEAQMTASINSRAVSCAELKSRIQDAGTLAITSAQGWGDVFHARIPRCEFWQRSQYAYVNAKDGWCGVGYTCVAKIQGS